MESKGWAHACKFPRVYDTPVVFIRRNPRPGNPSSTIKWFQHYRTSVSEKHVIFNNFSKICETKNSLTCMR
jgi:hypothetical protein